MTPEFWRAFWLGCVVGALLWAAFAGAIAAMSH